MRTNTIQARVLAERRRRLVHASRSPKLLGDTAPVQVVIGAANALLHPNDQHSADEIAAIASALQEQRVRQAWVLRELEPAPRSALPLRCSVVRHLLATGLSSSSIRAWSSSRSSSFRP